MDANGKELATIKNILKNNPRGMTVTEISTAMKLNRHSAAKYLEVLVASGYVDKKSFGPSKVYYISQRIPVSAMLSFSSDIIVILDKELIVRNFNDRFLDFMGLGRMEALNKNIDDLSYIRQMQKPMLKGIQDALNGKEKSIEALSEKDNKKYYFFIKFIPTLFEEGDNGVTIIMSNITERREAEEALRKAHDKLEARVAERTQELQKANRTLRAEVEKRKESQNALHESEDKFRNLVENVNDWIWETDNTGRFTYSSPRVREMLGYAPEEVIGMRPFDLMEPEKGKKMYYTFMEIARRGDTFTGMESEHRHKDGRPIFVEVSGMPIHSAGGKIVGYTGISHDITERKLAEDALFQRQREINTLLDSLPGLAFFKDLNGRYIMVNKFYSDIRELTKTDIIGKTDFDIFPKDLAQQIHADDLKIMGTGKPMLIEEDLPFPHKVLKVATRKTPLKDYTGNIIGLIGFSLDITGQKRAESESEAKFKDIVENINDIAWEMDKNKKFTYMSPKVRDILGYDPEYYLGRCISEFMPREDLPAFLEGFSRIFARPRPYGLETLRMFHRDGSIHDMEVNGSPFYNDNGEFMGFHGVTRDITKRPRG